MKDVLKLEVLVELRKSLDRYETLFGDQNLSNKLNACFQKKIYEITSIKKENNSSLITQFKEVEKELIVAGVEKVTTNSQDSVGAEVNSENLVRISEILNDLEEEVNRCRKCDLARSRTNIVFGQGNANAKIVLVGEAPGEQEDKTGQPFIGPAGQLLTKMLKAINIDREDVYICNVLKCRPPLNRDPFPSEIRECSNFLDRQLDIIKPRVILALGRVAAQRLLNIDGGMKVFRQKIHKYQNYPVIVTYHPSALLRNQKWKRPAWEDLQFLEKYLVKEYEK